MSVGVSFLFPGIIKGQVQGLRWFLTRFPLKFAENSDVEKLWSEGYKCPKTGIFCRTESIAMTLKIMCTYAHYVTLGSCCKMASNHRVTDLDKFAVRISKDEVPTPLPAVGPLFIPPLSFHLSRALLGAWRFGLFRCVYSSFHNRLDLIREPAFYWVFYFPNLSLFVSSYVKMKKFCSF